MKRLILIFLVREVAEISEIQINNFLCLLMKIYNNSKFFFFLIKFLLFNPILNRSKKKAKQSLLLIKTIININHYKKFLNYYKILFSIFFLMESVLNENNEIHELKKSFESSESKTEHRKSMIQSLKGNP
jgi:hypothetical protein